MPRIRMYPDSPCKGCSDRSVRCHIDCAKYDGWRQVIAEKKKRVDSIRYFMHYYSDRAARHDMQFRKGKRTKRYGQLK